MASGTRLSELRKSTVINEKSGQQQSILLKAQTAALNELTNELGIVFIVEGELKKREINTKLKQFHPDLGTELANERSSIRPDGGLVYVEHNGKRHLVLAAEAKRQGTNDQLAVKQSMGNAIERMFKNLVEIRNYMICDDYNPSIWFIEGCDFHKDSSMLDRISAATGVRSFNQHHIENLYSDTNRNMISGGTVFVGEELVRLHIKKNIKTHVEKTLKHLKIVA